MIEGGRALRLGLAFALGFGAVVWASAHPIGKLRGPRARVLAELNTTRGAHALDPVAASPGLARAARWELARLSRLPAGAPVSAPAILTRMARERGWRGRGELVAVALRDGPDAGDVDTGGCAARALSTWRARLDARALLLGTGVERAAFATLRGERGSLCVLVVARRDAPVESPQG